MLVASDAAPFNSITRLDPFGLPDVQNFQIGDGVGYRVVFSTAIQPDGKILLAGGFATFNFVGRNNIARINADGSLDGTFDAAGLGTDGIVNCLAVQPDGKILLAGDFTMAGGGTRKNIARLNSNGTLDGNFDPGAGPSSPVFCMALQPDGKILIGGNFNFVDGQARGGFARLNSNGSVESPATFSDTYPFGASVAWMALQADGKIMTGSTS